MTMSSAPRIHTSACTAVSRSSPSAFCPPGWGEGHSNNQGTRGMLAGMVCGDRFRGWTWRAARCRPLALGWMMVLAAAGVARAQPAYPGPAGAPPPGAAPAPWGTPAPGPAPNTYYPPPPPPGAWGAQPAPGPAAPVYGARWVHVVMNSDDPRTRLDRVVPGGGVVPVCFAPCNKMLES